MPVELRKRPPPKEPAASPPAAKRGSGSGGMVKKIAEKAKAAVSGSKGSGSAAAATEPEEPSTANSAPETAAPIEAKANGSAKAGGKIAVGEKITLDGFGGTVQTHDGTDVTVKELLEKSGAGIVIFTYPKASTPGCKFWSEFCSFRKLLMGEGSRANANCLPPGTTQACLFRDNYAPITGASLAIYGLSTDSPKANTTFVTKQKLPYPLLVSPASGRPLR
jgi:thioredoxin-dependent peroxiredoxin